MEVVQTKLSRYKVLCKDEQNFVIDLESNLLAYFFPSFSWFMKRKIFVIEDRTIIKDLVGKPKMQVSIWLIYPLSQIASYLAYGIAIISTLWDTYKDVPSGEKTVGEAVVKNTTKTAVGLGTASLVLGATNPVGWGIVGVVAAGIGDGMAFDFTYNRNLLGLQSGLDTVGNVVDNYVVLPLIDVYDWSKVKVEEIGASISGAWETINPLNWGW